MYISRWSSTVRINIALVKMKLNGPVVVAGAAAAAVGASNCVSKANLLSVVEIIEDFIDM